MKWLRCLAVGLVYVLLAKVSFLMVLPSAPVGPSLAWLPTGFAVAAVLIEGYGVWPGILLGSLLNAFPQTEAWPGIMGFALANTIDPMVAAWLPQRILGKEINFKCTRDVTVFIVVVIFVSSAISATIGTFTLLEVGGAVIGSAETTWLVWWVSDFLSVLLLAPMLMTWLHRSRFAPPRANWTERLLGAFWGAAMLFFIFKMPLGRNTLHFVYWIIPFVIWLGFRLEIRGATTGIFLLAALVVGATSYGVGPFIGDTTQESFLYVQSFLTVIAVLGLLLAAAVNEREAAIQVRDDFFLLAAHELKTPLTILGMQSYFLRNLVEKNELERLSPARRVEMVRINSKEIKRLIDLVEDLLAGARIVAGNLAISPEEMELQDLVAAVVHDYAPELQDSKVSAEVKGTAVRGFWDRKKLYFVVKTLLTNAIKFGAGKPVEIALQQSGSWVTLSVEDHGMGIAKEQQKKIFERFGHCAHLQYFGGLGQGLFISKAIIIAHRGEIRVESELGKGTKFTVKLPLRSRGTATREG